MKKDVFICDGCGAESRNPKGEIGWILSRWGWNYTAHFNVTTGTPRVKRLAVPGHACWCSSTCLKRHIDQVAQSGEAVDPEVTDRERLNGE